MARNLNNPETPKEGVEETKRDLDNLRTEVEEWEQSAENESTSVDSTEQLENDAEVKSGFEKILNKSFEKTISDFEKELPNDFTIDGYMKNIAETSKDLWALIAWQLWLPAGAFFWAWRESWIKFKNLEFEQKINFITLKKAIDKITAWKKELSKISYEKIVKEIWEENKQLINNIDKYLEWKPLSFLKTLGLTDGEYNKISTLLKQKWLTKEVSQEISQWGTSSNDDEEIYYGKHGTIVWREDGGERHQWRMSEIEPVTTTIAIWTLIKRWIGLLVAGWVIWWWIWYYAWRKSATEKPSTTNTRRENYWPVEINHAENMMRYMTHQAHARTKVTHAEQRRPGDNFLQRLGNLVWRDRVDMSVSGDVTTSFEWNTKASFNNGVLTVNVDKPTIFARNVEWVVLNEWWSRINLFPNDQVQMHAIKLWEYNMLQEYRWYTYNEVTGKWERDESKARAFEDGAKKSLEEWLMNIPTIWQEKIKKVIVNYNPWSETKIEIESNNRRDNPDVNVWVRDRQRPRGNTPHYKQKFR